jgi:ribonuclease PH
MQRISRKELSAQLTTTLQGVVDLDRFPKAVVDVAVLVLQVRLQLMCYGSACIGVCMPLHGTWLWSGPLLQGSCGCSSTGTAVAVMKC